MGFGEFTVQALDAALDGLAARQRVSAHNVANVATPNFTASKVDFEASLQAAVAARDIGQTQVRMRRSTAPASPDGNNVELDSELIGTTGLRYRLMLEAVDREFGELRAALR